MILRILQRIDLRKTNRVKLTQDLFAFSGVILIYQALKTIITKNTVQPCIFSRNFGDPFIFE